MTPGVRKSLSPQEHAIRTKFDAMRRDDERRSAAWSELQDARAREVRKSERLFVRIRFQEGQARLASCLIADLVILKAETRRWGVPDPSRIDATVSCELLFDGGPVACDRAGECPHDVDVFAMKTDNTGAGAPEHAWEALRQLAVGAHAAP